MNKNLLLLFVGIISLAFIMVSTVEAKRFGGGSSFGGKKSYSSPFKQKTSQKKSFSQKKASATNQKRKQQLSSRGGLMGMLGGLALGGLLGALFFGGAFENLNFFDFIIIGGIIWAIMWFIRRKAPAPKAHTATPGAYDFDLNNAQSDSPQNAASEKDKEVTQTHFKLNSDKVDAGFSDKETSFADSFGVDYGQEELNKSKATEQSSQSEAVILPEWFDQEEFLNGARSAYTLLQQAWDIGDLESIKDLTTESVFNEISRQFDTEDSQGTTRILQLNAELIDFKHLENHSEASVLFDALLDESSAPDDNQGRATQARELWHFVRANKSTEPKWYLDGLQQLK